MDFIRLSYTRLAKITDARRQSIPSQSVPLPKRSIGNVSVGKRIIVISVITVLRFALLFEHRFLERRRSHRDAGRARGPGGGSSVVEAEAGKSLFGVRRAGNSALEGSFAELVLRVAVAVVVDALVHDLVCHQRFDEFVVGCQQPADVLLAFDQLDIAQDLSPEFLAYLKPVSALRIVRDPLILAIDELEGVDEVCAGHVGRRDCLEHLAFLLFKAERLRFVSFVL